MGQSLAKNTMHIIFSTKNRAPLIDANIESELHKYLGGICNKLECPPIKIGGYDDHVHILCYLSKTIALSDFLEDLKKNSSKWIKTKAKKYKSFYWQDGYAAFSVSQSILEKTKEYIAVQHEHHSKISFKDELIGFLKKNGIEYDERYLWN
jgi:REP element-mobilizing transposase RayT